MIDTVAEMFIIMTAFSFITEIAFLLSTVYYLFPRDCVSKYRGGENTAGTSDQAPLMYSTPTVTIMKKLLYC